MPGRDLIRAYLTTRYVAYDDGREVDAFIHRRSPPMDSLLRRLSAGIGIFITAWNPRSQVRPEALNRSEGARLQAAIAELGLRFLPHKGFGTDPAWQPEEGLFVLDLPAGRAIDVAVRFGQNAIVAVRPGAPAELLLTPLMPA